MKHRRKKGSPTAVPPDETQVQDGLEVKGWYHRDGRDGVVKIWRLPSGSVLTRMASHLYMSDGYLQTCTFGSLHLSFPHSRPIFP